MVNLVTLMHDNSFHPHSYNDDEMHLRSLQRKHRDSDVCQDVYRRKAASGWVEEHFKHVNELAQDLYFND